MGHNRLGTLPTSRPWREVIELLHGGAPPAALAAAVTDAADRYLLEMGRDDSLNYCYWLLSRITWSARGDDFIGDLARLGLSVDQDTPTSGFIAKIADEVRQRALEFGLSSHTSEISSLALHRALSETVGEQTQSLFGSTVRDVQEAFRRYSTPTQFGALAHRFFGDLVARTLRGIVERQLPMEIGGGAARSTLSEALEAAEALDLHTRQSARIMRPFAEDWYSLHNWEARGEISQAEARNFVVVALRKLRTQLKSGSSG